MIKHASIMIGIDFAFLLPDALMLMMEIERIEAIAAGKTVDEMLIPDEKSWQEIIESIQASD